MNDEPHNLVLQQLRELRQGHAHLVEFFAVLRGEDLRNAFRALELESQIKKIDLRLQRLEKHLNMPAPDWLTRPEP